jgi:hypothetical protein
MDNTLDIDETLSKASDFISGGSTLQDYEQAAVLLAQIASVSPVAKDMLDRLAARGLGIECASATNIDYYSGSNQSRLDRLFQDLDPDANRCINCGITGYLMPWRDEALVCDERGGGLFRISLLPRAASQKDSASSHIPLSRASGPI